jgi:hypothetical protein
MRATPVVETAKHSVGRRLEEARSTKITLHLVVHGHDALGMMPKTRNQGLNRQLRGRALYLKGLTSVRVLGYACAPSLQETTSSLSFDVCL